MLRKLWLFYKNNWKSITSASITLLVMLWRRKDILIKYWDITLVAIVLLVIVSSLIWEKAIKKILESRQDEKANFTNVTKIIGQLERTTSLLEESFSLYKLLETNLQQLTNNVQKIAETNLQFEHRLHTIEKKLWS